MKLKYDFFLILALNFQKIIENTEGGIKKALLSRSALAFYNVKFFAKT
jgi:hypothetical protein